MTNEKGFFLPYVLFIVAVVFIVIITNINIYTEEIELTENHINQLKIETLMQMSREQLKVKLMHSSETFGTVYYNFSDGDVEIVYEQKSAEEYSLLFRIYLEDEYIYKMTSYLWINEL